MLQFGLDAALHTVLGRVLADDALAARRPLQREAGVTIAQAGCLFTREPRKHGTACCATAAKRQLRRAEGHDSRSMRGGCVMQCRHLETPHSSQHSET
jgi:hypothetical protein